MKKDFDIKSIPPDEARRAEFILWCGTIFTAMLIFYTFMKPDGYSFLGTYIPIVYSYMSFFKYFIAIIPLELSLKYFNKNIYHKYCLKNQKSYKSRPLLIFILFTPILRLLISSYKHLKKNLDFKGGLDYEK